MNDTDTDTLDDRISADHLYVCEYRDSETLLVGHDVGAWNEGLADTLRVRRDLGRIVHSWVVTEAGVRKLRTDHVTDRDLFVLVPASESHLDHPVVVEDADPTVEFPTALLKHGHVTTAVRDADPSGDLTAEELDSLESDAHDVVERVNDGIEAAFEERYESWRADQGAYPEGRDFGYEVPLDAEWKRSVIAERTDLSAPQVDLLATAGYPSSMRVRVDVDYPDAIEKREE